MRVLAEGLSSRSSGTPRGSEVFGGEPAWSCVRLSVGVYPCGSWPGSRVDRRGSADLDDGTDADFLLTVVACARESSLRGRLPGRGRCLRRAGSHRSAGARKSRRSLPYWTGPCSSAEAPHAGRALGSESSPVSRLTVPPLARRIRGSGVRRAHVGPGLTVVNHAAGRGQIKAVELHDD